MAAPTMVKAWHEPAWNEYLKWHSLDHSRWDKVNELVKANNRRTQIDLQSPEREKNTGHRNPDLLEPLLMIFLLAYGQTTIVAPRTGITYFIFGVWWRVSP
jgi:hypothetical protein